MDDQFEGMDLLDLNGDGYIDAVDTDGDGAANAFDDDGDGFFEGLDTNDDGVADSFDLNADREIDAWDTNGDGVADQFDTNGDGYVDAVDTNGDGVADQFDTNGDGYLDAVDTDGDGAPDMIDADGDGYVDTPLNGDDNAYPTDGSESPSETDADGVDLNGDGIADMLVDLDGDGFADAVDLDGDGIADSALTYLDFNGDGVADGYQYGVDLDGDGTVDILYQGFDSDGDGAIDEDVVGADLNGDGSFQTDEIYDADDWSAQFDAGSEDIPAIDETEAPSSPYSQFDPSQTDMDQVVGSPNEDADAWEYQEVSGPCAIFAQCMAYENLTGEEVDIDAVIAEAEAQGIYTPGEGTAPEDIDEVLKMLGAETEEGTGGTLDDLKECLEDGGRIIVGVDGDEIWCGDNDNDYIPNSPNHAVEVIGIDYSGEEPMVIINDSGIPDGHGIQVPASQFMDAWEDSGCAYVEAYAPGSAQ